MLIDKRIIKVTLITKHESIELENLDMHVSGSMLADYRAVSAKVEIFNLSHDLRQYILSHAFPTVLTVDDLTQIRVEVGRESKGLDVLFEGQIFKSEQTDKPNLSVILECISGYSDKFKPVTNTFNKGTTLKDIALIVAKQLNLKLHFDTKNISIDNYSFTGSALAQCENLSNLTEALVFVERSKNMLVVIDKGKSFIKNVVIDVNVRTGLIRANAIQAGIEIKMLYDPLIKMGAKMHVESVLNESIKGDYIVYKIDYSLTSRGDDFHLLVQAGRML